MNSRHLCYYCRSLQNHQCLSNLKVITRDQSTLGSQIANGIKSTHNELGAEPDISKEHTTGHVATAQATRSRHLLLNNKSWDGKLTLFETLLRNIVFENAHLLAINKPHNLPMQASSEPLTVQSVLPKLREHLGLDYLDIGVSLDRLHSGVLVLCKSMEMKARLRKHMLTSRTQKQPFKKFCAITMGIPTIKEGEESVPVGQVKVGGFHMTVIVDKYSETSIRKASVIRPLVKFKVLSKSIENNSALVQLQPTTTKWDFLQVFLTQHLCNILGDHMYSARVKSILGRTVLVDPMHAPPRPQVLPEDIRSLLQVPKEYQEWIPLHLHCTSVSVPKSPHVKHRTVHISAPLPDYFLHTAQLLGLHVCESFRAQDELRKM